MKTWNAKTGETNEKWWLIDATDKTVGRLATEVAMIVRGKRKPTFTPHVDTGDNVIVINSDKVKFTGNKWDQKKYYSHSRFFGSTKETTAREIHEKDSTKIMRMAIDGMLPKSILGRRLKRKVKIFAGAEHQHSAQKPEAYTLK